MLDPAQTLPDFQKIFYTGLVSAISSLIVSLLVYFTSSKAKAKEIKLSSYYKQRIEAIMTLYALLVDLYFVNNSLFGTNSAGWGHDAYKATLTRWLEAFEAVNRYYNKNRILLLERNQLSAKVRANFNQLAPLRLAIIKERTDLNEMEEYSPHGTQSLYSNAETEENEIEKRLNKLKSNSDITYIISSFEKLRIDLESYFKTLVT